MITLKQLCSKCEIDREIGKLKEKLLYYISIQVKELQSRLDEADAASLKGGKRIIQKLEQRVRKH